VRRKAVFILSISAVFFSVIFVARTVQSATCSFDSTPLTAVTAISTISLSNGMKYVTVDNPTPFITGMRIRAMTGSGLSTTKFAEGLVGAIRDCVVGIYIDASQGKGSLKNARFSTTGIVGLRGTTGTRGPRGFQGLTGPQGLQGPQGVQGVQGFQGISGLQGIPGRNGSDGFIPSFGSFYDTTTQAIDIVNTPQAITFNQTAPGVNGVVADGVSVSSDSRISVSRTGTYNIQFSAQLAKTDGGNDTMDIWLRVNNVDVAWTNTEVTISSTQRLVAAWNFMIALEAGNYFELMYSSADIRTEILAKPAQTGPTRPGIPSVILTVQQVR
jgi:hypothetical protein